MQRDVDSLSQPLGGYRVSPLRGGVRVFREVAAELVGVLPPDSAASRPVLVVVAVHPVMVVSVVGSVRGCAVGRRAEGGGKVGKRVDRLQPAIRSHLVHLDRPPTLREEAPQPLGGYRVSHGRTTLAVGRVGLSPAMRLQRRCSGARLRGSLVPPCDRGTI